MARNIGTANFPSGTGAKALNIGMTATWMQLVFSGSGIKNSTGWIENSDQYCIPAEGDSAVNKAIRVKNTSGTVVYEGTWTSFSGNNVNFNITTNTLGTPAVLLIFGN